MSIITGLLAVTLSIAAAFALLWSAYIVGRWTRQPWLPLLAACIAFTPLAFRILRRLVTRALESGAWPDGAGTAGGVLSVLTAAEHLLIAAAVAALVLLSARSKRQSREENDLR